MMCSYHIYICILYNLLLTGDHLLCLTHININNKRAGKNGRKEQIEQCSNQCQITYQRAGSATQQEIGNFQNRLNNAMMQCNNDAQAMITPNMTEDSRAMKKVEASLLKCIEGVVAKSRDGLKPMKQRIESQMA